MTTKVFTYRSNLFLLLLKTTKEKKMIKFGSRAWGCYTENSDYDFLLSKSEWEAIYFKLDKDVTDTLVCIDGYDSSGSTLYNSISVKFTMFGLLFNYIIYDDSEWDKAVSASKILNCLDIPSDRAKRYELVESVFRGVFNYRRKDEKIYCSSTGIG